MKKRNKFLALLLAMALCASTLVACQTSTQTSTEAPEQTKQETDAPEKTDAAETTEAPTEAPYEYKTGIKITLSGRTGATENWNDTMLIKLLEESFGVEIEATTYADDVWMTKLNLMMAEENMADIVANQKLTLADVSGYGADGYLLPINEYLEHMPNLSAFIEEHPEYWEYCTSPDGNVYGLLTYNDSLQNSTPYTWINEDWLNRVGKEYPTTLDELYDVLKAFKEQDANGNGDPNDEYPFVWTEGYSRKALTNILNACGIITTKNTAPVYGIMQVSDDGTVYLADASDNYRYFLKYMNKLWSEGLCLDSAYTITKAEVQGLIKENRVGVVSESTFAWPISETDTQAEAAFRWEFLGGMKSEVNDQYLLGSANAVTDQVKLFLSADTEYPEEVCRIIDFFFSEEGIAAASDPEWYAREYDTEGLGKKYYYDYSDALLLPGLEDYPQGKLSEYTEKNIPSGYDSWYSYLLQKAFINEGFNIVGYNSPTSVGPYIFEFETDAECDAIIEMKELGVAGYKASAMKQKRYNADGIQTVTKAGYPIMIYDADQTEQKNILWTDINLLCQQAQAQFIKGELDPNSDADWNTFLANLEKAGLSEYIAIEQAAYDNLYK